MIPHLKGASTFYSMVKTSQAIYNEMSKSIKLTKGNTHIRNVHEKPNLIT